MFAVSTVTMNAVAMLALIFGLLVCVANAQLPPSSCSGDPCFRPPEAVLPESEGTSEREAVATLMCFLDCEDSNTEVRHDRCLYSSC